MTRLRYTILLLAALGLAGCDDAKSGSGAQTATVTDQASDSENPRTAVIGQPVEDDGMTFVVKRFTAVPFSSLHLFPNAQLKAPGPWSRLWMLTVSVRNDGQISADPFCRNGHARGAGADLRSTKNAYYSWWDQSVLIQANYKLCRSGIQPGSTETYTLLYKIPKSAAKIDAVLLWNVSCEYDEFARTAVEVAL